MFRLFKRRNGIIIRPARPADAAELNYLHAQGFERAWSAHEFESLLSAQNVVAHLAVSRQPRGFVLSRLAGDEAEILSIVVVRNARRQGIGADLMRHHLAAMSERGARSLYLEVALMNLAAVHLYQSFAFREVGRRKSYYRQADGSRADALIMFRELG